MSSIKLTQSERFDLEKLHKGEHERRFTDRIKTILLLDEGWEYSQIAKILLLDDQTVRNYEKPKIIPGKADAEKQVEYLENILKPILEKGSDRTVMEIF